MYLVNSITSYSTHHQLIKSGATLVIGLSGGPDSVFLLHYLVHIQKKYSLTLIAAHLNHEWRLEADQEEQFCRELAERHCLPFESARMTDLAPQLKYGGSKEAFARNARRTFLESIASRYNADAIALGHHAQDQQETFFIRLMRGSSLTGLTAMRPKNGLYIRPLLETPKQAIMEYIHEHAIAYVIDQSNESSDFLRNRIRTQALPALRACDPRFDTQFETTLKRLQEADSFLDLLAQEAYAEVVVVHAHESWISTMHLLQLHPVLQQRVLILWLCQAQVPFSVSQAFLEEIIRFFKSPKGGCHSMNKTWHIIKKRKLARIITKV